MRYLFGFLCVCALGVMGCSETGGVGGDGRWDDWFWDQHDCPGCQCEGDYETFTTTLDCFCCRYHCEPGLGPFGNGSIGYQRITEYDCDRRSIYEFQENPSIEFVIDTTTNEVVAATYADDSGVCGIDGQVLRAGEDGLEGCEKISERECDGPCGTGGSGGAGGTGGIPECQGPQDCDDGNDCTGNACADGICEYTPLAGGTACDEGNECTVGMCAGGACDSTPVADGTTCGDGAGTCCSGICIPEILPVLDEANGIQASVFRASCALSSCHGSNGIPQAGLELSSASVSEANLIDVDSTQVDKLRVAPGDPEASYLLDKLLGRNLASGTLQQPPLGGPLCDPKIQAVEEWIAAGAN